MAKNDVEFTLGVDNSEVKRESAETRAEIEKLAKAFVDAFDDADASADDFAKGLDKLAGEVETLGRAAEDKVVGAFDKLEKQMDRSKLAQSFKDQTDAARGLNEEVEAYEKRIKRIETSWAAVIPVLAIVTKKLLEATRQDILDKPVKEAERLKKEILKAGGLDLEDKTLKELRALQKGNLENVRAAERAKQKAAKPLPFGSIVVEGTASDPKVKRKDAADRLELAQQNQKAIADAIAGVLQSQKRDVSNAFKQREEMIKAVKSIQSSGMRQ